MKSLIFVLSLVTAVSARADIEQKILSGFFAERLPDYLLALECPGVAKWEVVQARQWREAGDPQIGDNADIQSHVTLMRLNGQKISRIGAFFTFADDANGGIPKVEISRDGQIDRAALGVPEQMDGCTTWPLAINVTDQGYQKIKFMVDGNVYDKLSGRDQYIARLLLKGLRPSIIRSFFDTRQPGGSVTERISFHKERGFPVISLSGAELLLGDELNLVNGQVRSGLALLERGGPVDAVFGDGGRLRAAFPRQYRGFYAKKLVSWGENFESNKQEGAYAELRAIYRTDGSLAISDRSYWTRGGGQVKVDFTLVGGNIYDRTDIGYDRNHPLPSDFAVADYELGGDSSMVKITDVETELQSLKLQDNDPACLRGITFTNTPAGNKRFEVALRIPHNCVGLVKAVWKK